LNFVKSKLLELLVTRLFFPFLIFIVKVAKPEFLNYFFGTIGDAPRPKNVTEMLIQFLGRAQHRQRGGGSRGSFKGFWIYVISYKDACMLYLLNISSE